MMAALAGPSFQEGSAASAMIASYKTGQAESADARRPALTHDDRSY
jgi:hypothetical protein